MQIAYKSDIGLVRKRNEDAVGHISAKNNTIAVVCDGMGGHAAGDVAAAKVVEKIMH